MYKQEIPAATIFAAGISCFVPAVGPLLHRKGVETAVDDGNRTCHEA